MPSIPHSNPIPAQEPRQSLSGNAPSGSASTDTESDAQAKNYEALRLSLPKSVKTAIQNAVISFRTSINGLKSSVNDYGEAIRANPKYDDAFLLHTAGFYMVSNAGADRQMSGWNLFLQKVRERETFEYDRTVGDKVLSNYSKAASELWQSMHDKEKEAYCKEAREIKERKNLAWDQQRKNFRENLLRKLDAQAAKMEIMGFDGLFMVVDSSNGTGHATANGTNIGVEFYNKRLQPMGLDLRALQSFTSNTFISKWSRYYTLMHQKEFAGKFFKFVEEELELKKAKRAGTELARSTHVVKKARTEVGRDEVRQMVKNRRLKLWTDAGFTKRTGKSNSEDAHAAMPERFPSETSMRASLIEKNKVWELPSNMDAAAIFWRQPLTAEEGQFLLALFDSDAVKLIDAPTEPAKRSRANPTRAANVTGQASRKEVPVAFFYAGRAVDDIPKTWPAVPIDRLL